jgi:hypothetical protein
MFALVPCSTALSCPRKDSAAVKKKHAKTAYRAAARPLVQQTCVFSLRIMVLLSSLAGQGNLHEHCRLAAIQNSPQKSLCLDAFPAAYKPTSKQVALTLFLIGGSEIED